MYNSLADHTKVIRDRTAFVCRIVGESIWHQNVIGNVIPHDIDILFQGQILKSAIFRKWKTMTDLVQVTIDNNEKSHMGLRMAYLHLTLAQKVKVTRISIS